MLCTPSLALIMVKTLSEVVGGGRERILETILSPQNVFIK